MRTCLPLIFFLLVGLASHGQNISGFSEARAEAQREAEKKFDSHLNPQNLDQWMKYLSSKPHHVGSPFGKETAEFIRDQFQRWGYEAEIETFHVTFPTPRTRVLEM